MDEARAEELIWVTDLPQALRVVVCIARAGRSRKRGGSRRPRCGSDGDPRQCFAGRRTGPYELWARSAVGISAMRSARIAARKGPADPDGTPSGFDDVVAGSALVANEEGGGGGLYDGLSGGLPLACVMMTISLLI